MKAKIQDKIRYYTQQYDKFTDRWLDSNLRKDRDAVIRCKERVKCLKEVLEIVNAEK